jgi:hypothetical protein
MRGLTLAAILLSGAAAAQPFDPLTARVELGRTIRFTCGEHPGRPFAIHVRGVDRHATRLTVRLSDRTVALSGAAVVDGWTIAEMTYDQARQVFHSQALGIAELGAGHRIEIDERFRAAYGRLGTGCVADISVSPPYPPSFSAPPRGHCPPSSHRPRERNIAAERVRSAFCPTRHSPSVSICHDLIVKLDLLANPRTDDIGGTTILDVWWRHLDFFRSIRYLSSVRSDNSRTEADRLSSGYLVLAGIEAFPWRPRVTRLQENGLR